MHHGLLAVVGLKAGRCGAKETPPVRPVPEARVAEVLPLVASPVAAMIRLQLITGKRPGEVVVMRGIDLDMTGKLWMYRPSRHKTQYLDHERFVILGPKAQEIVRPFLKPDLTAHLFSPTEADAERRAKQHTARKTPLSCGNAPGTNVKRRPRKKPRDRYSAGSYARAIKYACERLHPIPAYLGRRTLDAGKLETPKAWRARLTPKEKAEIRAWRKEHGWHPHQLRHSAATNLRKNYGLSAESLWSHAELHPTFANPSPPRDERAGVSLAHRH